MAMIATERDTMTEPTELDEDAPRSLIAILHEFRQGKTEAQISESLAELGVEVKRREKSGKLVITIELKPEKDTNTCAVFISHDVKPPKPEAAAAYMFLTDEGSLSLDDPERQSLFEEFPPRPGDTSPAFDPETGEILDRSPSTESDNS